MARPTGSASHTRSSALATQHALTADEQRELVERVPAPQRRLFEAWLRGERTLDGDRIEAGPGQADD